jgi:hypothetical protein
MQHFADKSTIELVETYAGSWMLKLINHAINQQPSYFRSPFGFFWSVGVVIYRLSNNGDLLIERFINITNGTCRAAIGVSNGRPLYRDTVYNPLIEPKFFVELS